MAAKRKTTDIGAPPAKVTNTPTDDQKKSIAVTDTAKAAAEAQKVAAKAAADAQKAADRAVKEAAAAAAKVAAEAATAKVLKGLESAAKDIKASIDAANKSDGKAFDHRLSACIKLGEVKKKLEGTSVSLKKWAQDNVADENVAGLSYESLKVLARVGSAGDENAVKAALEDLRGKNKKANAESRKKAKGASEGKKGAAKTDLQRAEDAMAALKDSAAVAVARKAVKKSGMVVVSETAAKAIADQGTDKSVSERFQILWNAADAMGRLDIINYIEEKTGNGFAAKDVIKAGYAVAK